VSQHLPKGEFISTNDAISSLVWHVVCDLRGRASPGGSGGFPHGRMSLPTNARAYLPGVHPKLFGNANPPLLVSGQRSLHLSLAKHRHVSLHITRRRR
jgi:hypothetical protein